MALLNIGKVDEAFERGKKEGRKEVEDELAQTKAQLVNSGIVQGMQAQRIKQLHPQNQQLQAVVKGLLRRIRELEGKGHVKATGAASLEAQERRRNEPRQAEMRELRRKAREAAQD